MRTRTGNRGDVLVPVAAGSLGLGYVAGALPVAAAGAGAAVLSFVPWMGLFAALAVTAMIQSHFLAPVSGVTVGGFLVRPDELILVPFLARAYLFTRPDLRNRWGEPEWLLLGFVVLQPIATVLNAPKPTQSLPGIGLIALGAAAYYAVYASVCSARRLIFGTRALVFLIFANAAYGLLASASYVLVHTTFGISVRSDFGPGVYGLSFEHDIFASTCSAGAVVFYALWRERNPIVSSRFSALAFWVCFAAMMLGLSRGAWLAFGLSFAVLTILVPPHRVRREGGLRRAGVVLLLLTVIGLFTTYLFASTSTSGYTPIAGISAKAAELVNVTSGTGRARVGELHTALSDLHISPLIGLGTSTYNERHPLKSRNNYIGDLWLRALYDSGIIGLLLFLGFVGLVLWARILASRESRPGPSEAPVTAA